MNDTLILHKLVILLMFYFVTTVPRSELKKLLFGVRFALVFYAFALLMWCVQIHTCIVFIDG